MRAIQSVSVGASRPQPAKLGRMDNERATIAPSPRLTATSAMTTQAALTAPQTRFGSLAPRQTASSAPAATPSHLIVDFKVSAPTLLATCAEFD